MSIATVQIFADSRNSSGDLFWILESFCSVYSDADAEPIVVASVVSPYLTWALQSFIRQPCTTLALSLSNLVAEVD